MLVIEMAFSTAPAPKKQKRECISGDRQELQRYNQYNMVKVCNIGVQ